MKHIKLYENFLLETDGFGRDYFVKKKDGKSSKYFFKIEGQESTLCFVLTIGKRSRKISIESAENSYGVISVEAIKEPIMDDYLVNDTEYKSKDDETFILTKSEIMRFYSIVSEAIKDYLESNPKISIFYDEMLFNIEMEIPDYKRIVKNLMDNWSYGKWSIQEGSSDKIMIYSRRDHE